MKLPSARIRLPLAHGFRWALLLVAVALTGCETQRDIYVLTSTGKILGFDSDSPDKIDTEVSVSGLPGGESLVELGVRVREACVHWSSVEGPAGAVVLVSHVSPVKAATAWALGVGDEIAWRSHLDNASISQVLWRGDRPVLSLFNDTAHLADLVAPS